jgi:S-adenosylmethionine-diacylglycerol 3-amino-3-carboxypropyl transferase
MTYHMIADAVESHSAVSMRGVLERAFSLWFRRLVYTQIWEDPRVDMLAMEAGGDARIVTIASGGCNVLNYLLARPISVDAVDINPAHVALARLKLAAAEELPDHAALHQFLGLADSTANAMLYNRYIRPALDPETLGYWERSPFWRRPRIAYFTDNFYRHGLLGRFIGFAHAVGRLAGGDPEKLLAAATQEEQKAAFDRHIAPAFDHPVFRALCAMPFVFYSLGIPPRQFAALRADARRQGLGGSMAALMRERVRRLACDFPLADNYFAWQAFGRRYGREGRAALPDFLKPENHLTVREGVRRARVHLAPMTDFLNAHSPRRFDRFALLDSQDWMNRVQVAALWTAIDRAAAPGARVVFRTAAAASPVEEAVPWQLRRSWRRDEAMSQALMPLDRSAIYGGLHIYRRD